MVIVGTGVDLSDGSDFSLEKLAKQIGNSSGAASEFMFMMGLLAASLSSALTVAMGAAIACQSLMGRATDEGRIDEEWGESSWHYRGIIVMQLIVSFGIVAAGFDTVFVIMLSQIVGGVLLPTVSFCLLICNVMKRRGRRRSWGLPHTHDAADAAKLDYGVRYVTACLTV